MLLLESERMLWDKIELGTNALGCPVGLVNVQLCFLVKQNGYLAGQMLPGAVMRKWLGA